MKDLEVFAPEKLNDIRKRAAREYANEDITKDEFDEIVEGLNGIGELINSIEDNKNKRN